MSIRKEKIIITALVLTNILTILMVIFLYASAKIGRAELDEESHHLYLKTESLKEHILITEKGITYSEFLKKYEIERELSDFEIKNDMIEVNTLYFKFKEGVLTDIE